MLSEVEAQVLLLIVIAADSQMKTQFATSVRFSDSLTKS